MNGNKSKETKFLVRVQTLQNAENIPTEGALRRRQLPLQNRLKRRLFPSSFSPGLLEMFKVSKARKTVPLFLSVF